MSSKSQIARTAGRPGAQRTSSRKERYQAAIVGCGRIGCFLDGDPKRAGTIWTHAAAYTRCARTRLTALVDADPRALAAAAERWRVERTYGSVADMARDVRVDILSVCTPSDSHAALVRQAADAGVPAVWCEKPLAASLAEARQIADLSRELVIAVNHTRRWDKAYEGARAWVLAGRIGRLTSAQAYYTGGVSNIGSHLFDTLRYLLGEPAWVWAAPARDGEADPTISGTIEFSDGALCQVSGTAREVLLFEVDLAGTEGRLRVSDNGRRVEAWKVRESRHYSGAREFGSPRVLRAQADGRRMVRAVEDIVSRLDSGGRPRCGAVDGLKAMEMVAAFLASSRTERRVELPLPAEFKDAEVPIR